MFEELFRIIFDRRHIKDVRLWVLIVLILAEVASFHVYNKYIVKPIGDRVERHGKRIRAIIEVGHFRDRIDALERTQREPNKTPD
jgi:hypothetical protein